MLERDGWINLRRFADRLPAAWFPEGDRGEASCLRVLLLRHPGSADPTEAITRLLKAREEGPLVWEQACFSLHGDIARRLREGLPLPRINLTEEDFPCLSGTSDMLNS